ncbi:uncharacterized protein LACBIDRAFT_302582 [Laccaria bicolor S238N-H82]|uniref:Predicted protein n=1 Tax=Laccaria bicolor (strain S238N-H82 / ATCC MYA-4686) TaxID=486041 RepID=B0DHY0_LACBS|nr:uncharacterized protein LACBIDRAFT_302582 [Laccaria bicolor S238N-H82]EDR05808.1 predicted protein [Laccaria bicolor S238N-H82]|eukprot:XP_001883484.1 predicted protein [Laccaria bicolor S238N-H82]
MWADSGRIWVGIKGSGCMRGGEHMLLAPACNDLQATRMGHNTAATVTLQV